MKKNIESYEVLSYQIDLDLVEGEKASPKAIKVRNQAVKDMKEIKNYLKNSYPSTKFTLTKENIPESGDKTLEYYSLKMNISRMSFEDVHIIAVETITYMMVNNVGKNTLDILPGSSGTLNQLSTYADKSERLTTD